MSVKIRSNAELRGDTKLNQRRTAIVTPANCSTKECGDPIVQKFALNPTGNPHNRILLFWRRCVCSAISKIGICDSCCDQQTGIWTEYPRSLPNSSRLGSLSLWL